MSRSPTRDVTIFVKGHKILKFLFAFSPKIFDTSDAHISATDLSISYLNQNCFSHEEGSFKESKHNLWLLYAGFYCIKTCKGPML